MTFPELKSKSDEYLGPIFLESILNFNHRRIVRNILLSLFLVLLIATFFPKYVELYFSIYLVRISLILVAIVWIKFTMLEAMFYSFYFRKDKEIEFELANLINISDENDLTKSFLESEIVIFALLRCGLGRSDLKDFYTERDDLVKDIELEVVRQKNSKRTTFVDYANGILKTDRNLERYLSLKGVNKETFLGALDWALSNEYSFKKQFMWWSRDALVRIPSIGKDWSYGKTYLLEKYGKSIYSVPAYANAQTKWEVYSRYVLQIEDALLKDSGSNALLLVPTNDIGLSIVASFAKMIANGTAHSELEDKRIFVLDVSAIIDATGNKIEFENEISNVLGQAKYAGNVVIVIPNYAESVMQAINISSDLNLILNTIITSKKTSIIAISDKENFHSTLETNKNFLSNFEKVEVKDINETEGISILREVASRLETREKVFILYPTLIEIIESVNRYFSDAVFSDKIFDLLQEVVVSAKTKKQKIISPQDVLNVVNLKTGIPVGEINTGEKEILLNLESFLHKRVIGQDYAIKTISEALQRARTGMQNPNRPMGSFLFMGPTGVGKTETTKALAEIFFKDVDKIIRIDMSEFNTFDSVGKLIGEGNTVGTLAKNLRENPYGVLLLDEFEKADKNVHDLFLQILDEGSFTDSRGEKINAKNTIVIATSNAESDLIFELSRGGVDLSSKKDLIIEKVIKEKLSRAKYLVFIIIQ